MPFLQNRGSRPFGGILRIAVAMVFLIVAAIAVWQLSGEKKPPAAADPAVPVTASLAVRQDVPDKIETIGTVQSIDSVAIQSQVSGAILKIEFDPGQDVKKGQELFLIDPRPYQAALDQAQAQLAHDEAMLGEAKMDLKRYQNLAREEAEPAQQAQDQAYVVQEDQGTVEVDKANVETAKINLGYCHIKSPVDGRAGVLLVDLGSVVSPSASSANSNNSASRTGSAAGGSGGQTGTSSGLVSVSQMKPIYVSFPVAQTRAADVRQAQASGPLEVRAYSQAGKLLGTGKLTVIDNQVNTGTGTVTMQGTFANEDQALWPGEFVSVQLVVSMRRNVVTVPAEAVMTGASGPYVYVIGPDRKVRRADVEVTARQQGTDVIAKGISAGEEVVTDGQYRLDNGVLVEVQKAAGAKVAKQ